jgi:hypothetical protein
MEGKIKINKYRRMSVLTGLIQYSLKNGYWSFPLNIKELLQSIHDKGVLSMKLAVAIIKLAREMGDQSITGFIYRYYLQNLRTPEASMSIDLAIELVKLSRERGDQHTLRYFMSFLMKKLQEDNDVIVELALEVIKFAREVGDQQTSTQFLKTYLKALVDTRSVPKRNLEDNFLVDIRKGSSRRIPSVLTIELLKITREINDQQVIEPLIFYISQVLERSNYIQPELALEILKFTFKIKDREDFNNFKSHYLTKMLQTQNLVSLELAVELIKLALESKEHSPASIKSFYRKNITSERYYYLGLLPIDTIVDLRQLAQTFGDDALLQKINERLRV